MVSLPKPVFNAVLWFRPEESTTVSWAGEPVKTVVQDETSGASRLGPRNSFEQWRTTVTGHSLKWDAEDAYAAKGLRRAAIEIDLGAQVARALDAVAAREELVAVVSHDLRSPLPRGHAADVHVVARVHRRPEHRVASGPRGHREHPALPGA
jgi:chemotaxis family two-component system sensor kinase Cph1